MRLEGKRYKEFAIGNRIITPCGDTPFAFGNYGNDSDFEYIYIPHKSNFVKITKVTDTYVEGCFKARFIREKFLMDGIKTQYKVVPDSMFIECDKFVAPIWK